MSKKIEFVAALCMTIGLMSGCASYSEGSSAAIEGLSDGVSEESSEISSKAASDSAALSASEASSKLSSDEVIVDKAEGATRQFVTFAIPPF